LSWLAGVLVAALLATPMDAVVEVLVVFYRLLDTL
jgi:hypothetical protein